MGAAASYPCALDGGAASIAGLLPATVNVDTMLVLPRRAVQVDVVAQAGAQAAPPIVQALGQGLPDALMEPRYLL